LRNSANKHTNGDENITSLAEVKTNIRCSYYSTTYIAAGFQDHHRSVYLRVRLPERHDRSGLHWLRHKHIIL